MERFRLEVGKDHGAEVGNIVGAIANEAGIDSQYIGTVKLKEDHSFIDLPEGMPKAIFKDLRKVWVCGQKLQISRVRDSKEPAEPKSGYKKPAADVGADSKRKTKKTRTKTDSRKEASAEKKGDGTLSVKRKSASDSARTRRVTKSRNINKKRPTRTTD